MNKPRIVATAKIMHLVMKIKETPGLLENSKDPQLGMFDGGKQLVLFDPDAPDIPAVKIHELGHAMRYAIGIGDPADKQEEEEKTGLIEMGVCSFVRDNPRLTLQLVRELLGEQVWQRALKSMKP